MTNFLTEPCANNVPFPSTSMGSCQLGKLFRSYYIRLRMCGATASVDKTELHESLTNRMRDSRNRFVSSWQFRCFLGLITSKSAAIAFTGAFSANQWWKIKLGSFASMWKKHQSTDLEFERNLRMKRERMVISLQFAKLAVNVPNAHCYVYLYRRWWFLLLLLTKSSKINFFLDLFRLERDDYETFRKPSERFCPKATNHREPSSFVNTIIADTLLSFCYHY